VDANIIAWNRVVLLHGILIDFLNLLQFNYIGFKLYFERLLTYYDKCILLYEPVFFLFIFRATWNW
jgi:hypothetical protein